jgi:hypothetical protein
MKFSVGSRKLPGPRVVTLVSIVVDEPVEYEGIAGEAEDFKKTTPSSSGNL